MKKLVMTLMLLIATILLIAGCSGGGTGGGGDLIVIAGYVVDNSIAPATKTATVTIMNENDLFTEIDNAEVTLNGTTLDYSGFLFLSIYSSSSIDLNPGDSAAFKVVINGTTYLDETVVVPAAVDITAPANNASYNEPSALDVTWSGPTNVDQYSISIDDDPFTPGTVVAAGDDYIEIKPGTASSHPIPAGTLADGYTAADIEVSADNFVMVNSNTYAIASSIDTVTVNEP